MTHFSEEIFRIWEENEENEEDENISYPKVKLRERLRMGLTLPTGINYCMVRLNYTTDFFKSSILRVKMRICKTSYICHASLFLDMRKLLVQKIHTIEHCSTVLPTELLPHMNY